MKKILFLIIFCLFFSLPKVIHAERYDLIAPSGNLSRGQTITFTVNVDTQSKKLTSAQIGMTYNTQVLEFINVTPGNTLSAITSTAVSDGKFLISGSDTSGFNGQGVFAYANFKIVATAPGSTELCTLWAPSTQPTSSIQPTATSAPLPTSLPKSGNIIAAESAGFFGLFFVLLAGISLVVVKKII